MVVSEVVAATMIAVCGLKRSYRIVLRGERIIRRRLRRPEPIISGYESMPRSFVRTVFRAGHSIAMKWEGRAQNAAQRARAARLQAQKAREKVADVSADVRARAEDVRLRAGEVRDRARENAAKMQARAEDVRNRAEEVAERARENASKMQSQLRAAQEAARLAQKQVQDAAERLAAARQAASAAAIRARDALSVGKRESRGLADALDDDVETRKLDSAYPKSAKLADTELEKSGDERPPRGARLHEKDQDEKDPEKKSTTEQDRQGQSISSGQSQ